MNRLRSIKLGPNAKLMAGMLGFLLTRWLSPAGRGRT